MKKCLVCGRQLDINPLLKFDDMPASAQDIPDGRAGSRNHA